MEEEEEKLGGGGEEEAPAVAAAFWRMEVGTSTVVTTHVLTICTSVYNVYIVFLCI